MKSKLMMTAIALALLTGSTHAQEVINTAQKKAQINAIDKAINGLKHFKACLLGKEPCGKLDFVALGASLLFVHGAMTALRSRFLGPYTTTKEGKPTNWTPWKKNIYRLTTIADPQVHGYLLFHKPILRK